jgi:5'-AMP-activated protein kinase catalytic alpha subunit
MNIKYLEEQILIIRNSKSIEYESIEKYFKNMFKHLSIPNVNKDSNCSLYTLASYLNFPLVISKRIFQEFSGKDQLLTEAKFIWGMTKLFFGSVHETVEIFFNIFKSKEKSDIINLHDILLSYKLLSSNQRANSYYEKIIYKFSKKAGSVLNFENFQNYIFSEDSRPLIYLMEVIYNRKPFSNNILEYFQYNAQTKYNNIDNSFSTADISDENMSDIPSHSKFLEYESFSCYKYSDKKFTKYRAVIVDNNIFLFGKNKYLKSVIPTNSYFISKDTLTVKTMKLFSLNFDLKSLEKKTKRLFFKLNDKSQDFLKVIDFTNATDSFNSKYKYLEPINKGSFASVLLFERLDSNQKVAVKIICKHEVTKNDLVANEIDTLKFIKENPNKNIVKIEQIYEDFNYIYVVMEYLPTTLTSVLDKKLNDKDKNEITKQLANGINFLHQNGIIHRDIKPDNIMIDKYFNVKIIDFGFSKCLFKNDSTSEHYGTLAFVAPEVLNGIHYNFKADTWSFGIIVYLVYNEVHPYGNELYDYNYCELIRYISNVFTLKFSNYFDHRINTLINGCLEKNPMLRFNFNDIKKVL